MKQTVCDICGHAIDGNNPARSFEYEAESSTRGVVRIRILMEARDSCLRCFHIKAQAAVDALANHAVRATVGKSGRVKL